MDENFELEGEAHYCKGDEEDINPDTDLSYIDEKVQIVLGHHLKAFDGAVSVDNLGAKFGPYGSFLPTHERLPSTQVCRKTPQRDSTALRSQYNFSMEGASQDLKPTSNAPLSARVAIASCSDHSLLNSGMLPGGVSVKHHLPISSQVAEKFKLKDGSPNKSENLTNQRILRVRIKVSSDKMAHKSVAINSGLGIENSPSSSLGNSAEVNGGRDPVPRETAEESPTSILEVMTSFAVPEGVLISPLHESLLCLIGKDSKGWEPVPLLRSRQEHSTLLADDSFANMRDGKVLKEKKTKLVGKSGRPGALKHMTDMKHESNTTSLPKKEFEIETLGCKEINSNSLRCIPLANSICFFDSVKGTGSASEILEEANKDGRCNILFSSNLGMEDSLESISGQDSGGSQKNSKSGLVERVWEQGGVCSQNDVSHYHMQNGRCKDNKAIAPSKSHSDGSKSIEVAIAPRKQKVDKKLPNNVRDKTDEYGVRTNPFIEGKKSNGNQRRGKAFTLSVKQSSRNGTGMAPKDTTAAYDASTCKSKKQKLKLGKDMNKDKNFRYDFADANLGKSKNPLERQSGGRPKDFGPNNLEVELKHDALLDKSWENSSGKEVSNHAMHGPFVNNAPFEGPCNLESRHGTESVAAVVNPILIEENWVCCDSCEKWRLLPIGTKPEQFPDDWLCSMLNWLPGMNRCDISEEETTKAVRALYQLSVIEGQNSIQNYGNVTASVTTLAHGRQHDQSLSSVSIRGKKNNGLKEIPKADGSGGIQTSKSTKNKLRDSVKSRSINEMNQPLPESKIMKKPNSLHFNMSCNLNAGKDKCKSKEKQMNGGDAKQLNIKNKRSADQHDYATLKKSKIKDMCATDKHKYCDVDIRRVDHQTSAGLQSKAGGKRMLEYGFSYLEDVKGDMKDKLLLPRKKLGDQAEVSLDGGSLDMKTQDLRNNSVKKRKQLENLNGLDSKEYIKEESSEIGSGWEKKPRVQKTAGKNSSANKGAGHKSNSRLTPFMSSNDHLVDGMENVRSVDKDQQLQKPRRKLASQHALDGIDLMRRVFGSGEVSEATTSSSSKVTGSHKNRANFAEVKGSPVESVSSSPFRTFHPDKLTSTAEEIFGKDDGGSNRPPVDSNPGSCWNGEGVGEINQSFLKKNVKYESEIDVPNHAMCKEIRNEDKNRIPERSRSKFSEDEKTLISRRDLERQLPSDGRMEKQVAVKENQDSNLKLCANTNRKVASQQNLMLDYGAEKKVNHLQREERNGISKLVSLCQSNGGQKMGVHQLVPGSQREGMLDEIPVDSRKGDVSKASNHPGTVGNRNGAQHSPSCRSMKSSSQNATNALKEAKELRDYADRLKSSGFDFESNEAYFQAALQFLHGAFLLETFTNESGKNGEITPIQAYNTAAKLYESCAHEYERCQEMAAAALAYKCIEVAYMRVVYCKHSSASRDGNELQTTLHIASQGESPSSSASDVDNLNNQVTADKATSSKGAPSYITGNHVIVARNRPNFIRLLDFTQDVNFALEASRKSQNAFAVANVTLEEAQNTERITTIRRVIDFSFQDVDGLIRLVRLAMEAINCSGFGGARD
ncbi:uncharacterized protein LOC116132874 [Pistacia vera]|uniref:uncharacterized protein LOC116132874 n=1 Tax=Pistacia vera TaxID=55513 RepID=UPI001262D176|nr:uncharacterized protein LOC116132874 [Pistacia vera]